MKKFIICIIVSLILCSPITAVAQDISFVDSDTGLRLAMSSDWVETSLIQDREGIDVKFFYKGDASESLTYGSSDVWSKLTDIEKRGFPRSKMNNTAYTTVAIAEMLGVESDKVTKAQYGEYEYFEYRTSVSTYVEGSYVSVPLIQLLCFQDGWMYFIQFSGDTQGDAYESFVSTMQSVEYASDTTGNILQAFFPIILLLLIVVVVIVICQVRKGQEEVDTTSINTDKGTKWFVFFAKIRPWIAIAVACGTCGQFMEHEISLAQHWWFWVDLLFVVAIIVLEAIVFIKSKENYVSFVDFVEKVLFFDVLYIAYQSGWQQYSTSNYGWAVSSAVVVVLGYFLWYRLNVAYFRDRIRSATVETNTDINVIALHERNENAVEQEAVITEPTMYSLRPIQPRPGFVDERGWTAEIARLNSDEIYSRYRNKEEWSKDYRALCYAELMRRQKNKEE